MKKISFILIALLFTNFFYAQKKRVTISESKIGGLSNSYTKSINLETKGMEIFRMSNRAKLMKPVNTVTTTAVMRATMPLTMLKMLYAY